MNWFCLALLVILLTVPQSLSAEPEFRPEELKLFIPKPKPRAADIQIRSMTIPTPPQKPSPTATELLNPIMKVFGALDFSLNAQGEALNAEEFKEAKNLAESPNTLDVETTIKVKPHLRGLSSLDLMIAKRAMKAVSEYEPSDEEVTGNVCINAKGLFQKINAFPGVKPGGTEPQIAVIQVPAKELVNIKISERENHRNAAVTLEYANNTSFQVNRFNVVLPLKITWNYGLRALLAEGSQLASPYADMCVLQMELGPLEPTLVVPNSLNVPRTERVKDLTHVQVRVAPFGRKILGQPILVGAE